MEITEFYHIMGKLGKASIQQYVINLGRYYFKLKSIESNDYIEPTNSELIEKGSKVLERMFDLDLVTKEYQSDTTKSMSLVVPTIPLDQLYEHTIKEYNHMFSDKPISLDLQQSKLGKYTYSLGLNGTYTTFSKSNEEVISKLCSISLRVNRSYSIKRRTPKKGSIDINYRTQTTLFRKTLKEYEDKHIHLMWQYDARGRMYPRAYTLNPHGCQWQKVQLEFARQEKITDRGLIWLKRDIASNYGLDKENHEVKEDWFDSHEKDILDLKKSFVDRASSKLMFLRAVEAYKNAINDKPIGLPVSLDSTSSSIQLMSLLSRDQHTARLTNIGDSSNREDFYLYLTDKLFSYLDRERSKEKIHNARDIIKKCGMIFTYNGMSKIKELLPDDEVRQAFLDILSKEATGVCQVQDLINESFIVAKDNPFMEWSMPDGMHIKIPQITNEYLKYKTMYFNVSFKMDTVGCDFDANKRSLAPNYIHSIDSYICRQMILRSPCDIIPIHDCYQVHPNYCDETLSNYNNILNEISNSDLLGDNIRQIRGERFTNPFLDKPQLNTLKCKYSIC